MTAIFTGLGAGAERGSGNVLGGAGLLGSGTLGRGGEQVLLNAATGNLMIQQRDEMLVGRGPDAVIARTYNSQGDFSDDNADNWRQSTDRRVYGLDTSTNTVKRMSADGSEITYTWNASASAYVATDGAGAYDKLTWNGVSAWTWTDGDSQMTETYAHAAGGQYFITAQADTSGNALAFSYVSGTDKIDRVTTADGGYTQYSWSGNNITQITTGYTDLSTSTAKTLTRTRYAYDAFNRLTSVTVDLTPEDNSVTDGKTYVTTYTYVSDTSKLVQTITETDGTSLTIGYDGSNRVHTLTQAVVTGVNRVTTIDYHSGYSTVTDAAGQVTQLDYDSADQLTKITSPIGQVTKFVYNANGDVTSVIDALGNATTYSNFTSFGQARTITDRLTHPTTRTFGSKNELLTESVYGVDQSGNSVVQTTRYVYGPTDLCLYIISPDGDVYQQSYDANGQHTRTQLFTGQRYDLTGMASGDPLSKSTMNSWVATLADPTAIDIEMITYDTRGNITAVDKFAKTISQGNPSSTDPYSLVNYTYDQAGQLLSRNDYQHSTEHYVYDGLGRVVASVDMQGSTSSILFDDAYSRTIVTLANGLTQTSTYNLAGDLLAHTESGSFGGTTNPASNLTTSGQWIAAGLNASTTTTVDGAPATLYSVQSGSSGQALIGNGPMVVNGDTVTFEVTLQGVGSVTSDFLGLYGTVSGWGDAKVTIVSGEGSAAIAFAGVWKIDGLRTDKTTRVRITRTFATTEQAKLYLYVNSSSGYATNDATIVSAPILLQAPVATSTYLYDQLGQLRVSADATGRKSYFVYDTAGRKIGDVDQDLNLTEYKYDADNRVIATVRYARPLASSCQTALTAGTFTLDGMTRPTPDSDNDLWTFKVYDKEGRIIEVVDGAGDTTAYSYDDSGKLTSTSAYANKLSATQIAGLKSAAMGTQLIDMTDTSQWHVYGLSTSMSGSRYQVQTTGGGGQFIRTNAYHVSAGQSISFDVSVTGDNTTGATANAMFAFLGTADGWGDGSDLTLTVLTGPGLVTSNGGFPQITSLSTGTPTHIRITRTFASDDDVVGYFWVDSSVEASTVAGHAVILANPTIIQSPTIAYTVPTADPDHDRVSRIFYDKTGRVVGLLDGEGDLSEIVYDGVGQKVAETAYAKRVSTALRAGGSFTALKSDVGTSSSDRTTRYVYDNQGLLTFAIDALNHVTEYVYPGAGPADVIGRPRETIQYAHAITVPTNCTVATVRAAVNVTNTSSTNGENRRSWAIYDVHENLTYTIDATGAVTGYTYDAMGHVVSVTRFAATRDTTALPTDGDMTTSWVVTYGDHAKDRVTRNYYDSRGNLTFTTDGEGYVTRFDYDADNRLVGAVRWDNAIAALTATTLAGVASAVAGTYTATATSYDNEGRIATTTDGNNVVTRYVYNANGTLQSSFVADGTADKVETRFVYDGAGRVKARYDAFVSFTAPVQTLTQYSYTAFGQILTITDANLNSVTHAYDLAGRLVSVTDAENASLKTSYQYNAFGEVTVTTDRLSRSSYAYYDVMGRVIATRDADNRVVETNYTVFGDVESAVRRANATTATDFLTRPIYGTAGASIADAARDHVTTYEYDKDGRVHLTTDVENGTTTITYTAFGEVDTFVSPLTAGTTVQTTNSYDRRGLLKTQIVDSVTGGKAISTSYEYDSFGRQTKVTNALTKFKTATYDQDGRLKTTTDELNNTTTYTYDKRGNLVEVDEPTNRVTRYVYDKNDRRIAMIDAVGAVTVYSYDGNGNVTVVKTYTQRISFTTQASLAQQVASAVWTSFAADTAHDHVTRYAYDKDDRLRFTVDGLGHVTERVYDAEGNVLHTIAYDGTIAPASYTVNVIATAVANLPARVTRFVYDNAGQLMYSIDALNRVTGYVYDAFGNVTKTTEFATAYSSFAISGDPSLSAVDTWATTPNSHNRVTLAKYDRDGRLRYSVDAMGFVTRIDYDKAGHVKTQTAYLAANSSIDDNTQLATLDGTTYATTPDTARVTEYGYDRAGRLISTTSLEDGAAGRNTVSITTYLELDALGQVTSSMEGYNFSNPSDLTNASTTAYEYDDAGRVVKQIAGSGTADASTTWFYYDALGRKAATVDGDNYLCVYTYDAAGQLTHETHYATRITGTFDKTTSVASLIGLAGAVNSDVQTAYDAFGAVQSATDARGSVLSYDYDAIGEVKTQTATMDPATTADNIETKYSYDNFGNVAKTIDARGNASFAYYDALDRVTRQVDAERFVTDTTYTRGDQVESVKRWHEALGVSVTVSEAAKPDSPAPHALDATTSFEYDDDDRLTKSIEAEGAISGSSFQFYYEQYTLDAFGNRIAVRNKLGATSTYAFNKRGQVLTETLPITTWTGETNPTSLAVQNTYSYDLRGNRTQMVEASGAAEARQTDYAYDALDRLRRTTHDGVYVTNADLTTSTTKVVPIEIFNYDHRGNLIESSVGHLEGTAPVTDTQTLSWYDYLGHVTATAVQTDFVGNRKGALSTFTYDANGNRLTAKSFGDLVTLTDPAGAAPAPVDTHNYRFTSYTYDRANRLTDVTAGDGTDAKLLTGEWNSVTTAFDTSSGTVTTHTEYDFAGNVISQSDGRGSVYSWYDKIGRKTAQLDAENYLTTWTRDAEGNALSETRFAAPVSSFTPGSTPPSVGPTAADRTTTFDYDRNGRRLQEHRSAVAYASINASNGALTAGNATSTVIYTYNGLGEVLSKVEANGDTTGYTYDSTGRLTLETGQFFTDYLGNTVTPRTAYTYDGLNNLKSTRVQIDASGTNADDRVTTYTYADGAGGRLSTMTDAAGFTHTYGYDVAGRTMLDRYVRKNSAGADLPAEAIVYRYDLAGRVTTQSNARFDGSSWVFTDADGTAYEAVRMRYDAYGEMTGRGVTAGPGATAVYQEVFHYDAGGRLWHSNSGDGVERFYVYDKAGNQTLTLTSTGADLTGSGFTLANYTSSLTSSGDTSLPGAVTTISVHDRNGRATATIAPDRELTAIGSGTATLTTAKTYNAFGEVSSETDARSNTTYFYYNTMGRLVQKVGPQVAVTAENGAVMTISPTDNYAYDLSGRLVAVEDANSATATTPAGHYYTTRLLLAGTGHGDSEAQVTSEFRVARQSGASYSSVQTKYDVFGDARAYINELGFTTLSDYDKIGRLITVTHPQRAASTLGNESGAAQQLVDHYVYDGLGRRTGHWNSQFGSAYVETTDYDVKGRVTATVGFAGDTMSYAYSAFTSSIATSGLGTFGGWTRTVTNAAASIGMTDKTDYFGRTVDTVDYGSHDYDLGFDKGGRLTTRSNSAGESIAFTWYNSGLAAGQTGTQGTAAYTYDANGNRLTETLTKGGTQYRNASASYDALGRMTHWEDQAAAVGGSSGAPVRTDWEYDAVGNVRHTTAYYAEITAGGGIGSVITTPAHKWYTYDQLNEVLISQGTFTGSAGSGSIARGTTGTTLTWNVDGTRATATTTTADLVWSGYRITPKPWAGGAANWFYVDAADAEPYLDSTDYTHVAFSQKYEGETREIYGYTADGQLATVSTAAQAQTASGKFIVFASTGAVGAGTQTVWIGRDALGRITHYLEAGLSGGSFERRGASEGDLIVYDRANRELSETSITYRSDGGYQTNLTNTYTGGLLTRQQQQNLKGGVDSAAADTDQSYTYQYWDGAIQSGISYDNDTGSSTNALWTTAYAFDASGHVTTATIADGQPRTATFVTDQAGMVIDRTETRNSDNTATGPRSLHYLFGAQQIGTASNNGTDNTSYTLAMRARVAAPGTGPFAGGATTGTAAYDFDQNYDAINGSSVGSAGGSYTAQGGETLANVAQQLWGDASLWYLLADANGMGGSTELTAGQVITIPNKVINRHNTSDTFRPYDPNEAMGDTSPTDAAKPPKAKGNKCGVFGQILQAVITIAVGNIAGQLFGMATGIQQGGFSWKSLAISAITAAVTFGVGEAIGQAAIAGSKLLTDVVSAVAANAITQGVSVATGLQKKFDWAGVAIAGVTAGVSGAVSRTINPGNGHGELLNKNFTRAESYGVQLVSGMAGGIAGAGLRSVITGTSFGDNLKAVLPDVIAQTLGRMATDAVVGGRGSGGGTPLHQHGDSIGYDSSVHQQPAAGSGGGTAFHHNSSGYDFSVHQQPAAGSGASGAPVANLSEPLGGSSGQNSFRGVSKLDLSPVAFLDSPDQYISLGSGQYTQGGLLITKGNQPVFDFLTFNPVTRGDAESQDHYLRTSNYDNVISQDVLDINSRFNLVDPQSNGTDNLSSADQQILDRNNLIRGVYLNQAASRSMFLAFQYGGKPLENGNIFDASVLYDFGSFAQTRASDLSKGLSSYITIFQGKFIVDGQQYADLDGASSAATVMKINDDAGTALGASGSGTYIDQLSDFVADTFNGIIQSGSQQVNQPWSGAVYRAQGGDGMDAAGMSRQDTGNYLAFGLRGYVMSGEGFGTGAALAPAGIVNGTFSGGYNLLTDPGGSMRGMYSTLSNPSSWFSGLRNAYRTGDPVRLGYSTATIAGNTLLAADGVNALSSMRWSRIGGAAETAVPEGVVYSRIDRNGEVRPYGGQAQSYERYLQRQTEHARTYPDADFKFSIIDRANPGIELDIAEHRYIQQLTGGVRASKSPLVSNLKDPVGPARRPSLGLPEPRKR